MIQRGCRRIFQTVGYVLTFATKKACASSAAGSSSAADLEYWKGWWHPCTCIVAADKAVSACGWLWCGVLQRMVLEHVGSDTILVGHALENDLKSLKVCGKGSRLCSAADVQHSPAAHSLCT